MPRDRVFLDLHRLGFAATGGLLATALALGACQQGTPPAPATEAAPALATTSPVAPITDAYRADIDNLCNAMERSGAGARGDHDKVVMSAQWLGEAITTEAGVAYLVAWKQMPAAMKSRALRAEAARAGVAACPLAAMWDGKS
jgi:hypothetical protein